MSITDDALQLQLQLDEQIQGISDAQARALVAMWVLAWAEVSGDLQDALETVLAAGGRVTAGTLRRSLRLRSVLVKIATRLDDLAGDAGVRITSDLQAVVDSTVSAQRAILGAQLPDLPAARALLGATTLPRDAMDAIVERTTEQITSLLSPLSDEAYAVVQRELIRGVAVGSNPRATAARMVRRAEQGFNGGLARALNIARTETLDAHREAAREQQNRHTEVLAGWIWLCHLSPRTCPSCLVKHGTLHPLDEPGPEDHQQGRCSRMPKVKPWAELGFDVDEPEDVVPDARAWFEALPEADQVAIMGRERLALLRAGKITWDDLTALRQTEGWRDSWGMTSVRALRRQSRAGRAA